MSHGVLELKNYFRLMHTRGAMDTKRDSLDSGVGEDCESLEGTVSKCTVHTVLFAVHHAV